mgnify:CR=1 FL=1
MLSPYMSPVERIWYYSLRTLCGLILLFLILRLAPGDVKVDAAKANDVCGWVKNNSDGTVEAVLEGREDAVNKVIGWCHIGPPKAAKSCVPTNVCAALCIASTFSGPLT